MNKITFLLALGVVAGNVLAEKLPNHNGELIKPGTGLKSIAIVNLQSRLAQTNIDAVAQMIDLSTDLNIRSVKGQMSEPAELFKATGSEFVLLVKDDPKAPTLLIAPEDRWGVVNVAKLVDDLPSEKAKSKFFASRARKEIIKGFFLLCGGGKSQYPGNIMNTATVRGLDLAKEQIPFDKVVACREYLEQLGFRPKEYMPYEGACLEGWAPLPTNDEQRAIWKMVKEPPTNPLKIRYNAEKKTGEVIHE